MTGMFARFHVPYRRVLGIASVVILCTLISTLVIINPNNASRASAASGAQVTVNARQSLGTLSSIGKGLNTAVWDGSLPDSSTSTAVKNVGVGALRYPGGSTSDVYHWQSNTAVNGGYANPSDTFMEEIFVQKQYLHKNLFHISNYSLFFTKLFQIVFLRRRNLY